MTAVLESYTSENRWEQAFEYLRDRTTSSNYDELLAFLFQKIMNSNSIGEIAITYHVHGLEKLYAQSLAGAIDTRVSEDHLSQAIKMIQLLNNPYSGNEIITS